MRARWPFAIALLLALAATPAAACSPGRSPAYRVRCTDGLEQLQEHYGSWTLDDRPQAGETIGDFCPAAPAEAHALFDKYVRRDIVSYDWRRSFTIEPYTMERELEITRSREDYRQCHYEDFERAGDWLAIAPYRRGYCPEVGGVGGMCPTTQLSVLMFFPFLLLHLNSRTLPYLIPYLIILLLIVLLLFYLRRRGELGVFFRPTRSTVGWYVAPFLLCCFWFTSTGVMWNPVDMLLGWLLFGYLLCCLARSLLQRPARA